MTKSTHRKKISPKNFSFVRVHNSIVQNVAKRAGAMNGSQLSKVYIEWKLENFLDLT